MEIIVLYRACVAASKDGGVQTVDQLPQFCRFLLVEDNVVAAEKKVDVQEVKLPKHVVPLSDNVIADSVWYHPSETRPARLFICKSGQFLLFCRPCMKVVASNMHTNAYVSCPAGTSNTCTSPFHHYTLYTKQKN